MKTKRFRPSTDVDCAIDNFFAGEMLCFNIYIYKLPHRLIQYVTYICNRIQANTR
jgi:hypothetical protein